MMLIDKTYDQQAVWFHIFLTDPVIPMYYYVHKDNVEDEKAEPGSQVGFSE